MRSIKLLALLLLLPILAAAQGRTTDRVQDAPFSQLTTSRADGSIRNCINCQATTPCTSGGTGALAVKINGVWSCSDLSGSGGSGGAPVGVAYITRTPDNTLSGEQALSLLATGLVKNTTGTGLLSIATAGTDFLAPNGSGAGLTNLNASALSAGTVPDARFPAVLPPASAVNLTNLNALNISGVIPIANLATGTPTGNKFIRDDGTLQAIPGGGDALTASPLSQFASTTSAQLAGVLTDETGTGAFVRSLAPIIIAPTGIVKGDVGLGSVDDTSDAAKNAAAVTLTNHTISGAANTLTNLPAGNISGVIPIANLATGTPDGTKFIRDDGTLQTIPGGGDALTANPLSQFAVTTSAQLAGVLSNETGSGSAVFATSPTLVTPTLGVATATSINKLAITAPATSATLTIAEGKTLTAANTLTLTGTDASSIAFGTGGTVAYTSNNLSFFAATTSAQLRGILSDEVGLGLAVFNDSPVIITPTIANLVNMGHSHANAAGGGQLTDAALSAAVSISKGGTGQTTATAGFNALDPLTTKGDLLSHDGTNSIRLAVGTNGQCIKANSATTSGLEYGTCGAGTGDFVGPASSTDNAVVRFDSTTGKLGQNSAVTIDDSGNLSANSIISGSGSSVAGTLDLTEGTAPSLVANTFSVYAPVDVAVGGLAYVLPGAAASGLMRAANSSGVMTITHDGGVSHLASSTSADLRGVLSDETGTGPAVFQQTPVVIFGNAAGLNIQDTDASHVMDIALGSNLTAARTFTITPGDANRTLNMAGGNLTLAGAFTTSGANALTLTTTGSTNVTLPTTGTLATTVASGTAALGTSAIASGACATAVTATATGAATTDVVGWGFNSDVTSVTGYQASANGMLTILVWPTTNQINIKTCNNTASSVTPGAVTLNWRIGR